MEAGGVSLSIISGRRSPEDELYLEGLLAGLQEIDPGYCSRRKKQHISIKILLINLQLGGGLALLRVLHSEDALWGRTPRRSFLPLFRHLHFQVFGGGPFLPVGGGNLGFTSPIILLSGDINPLVWMYNL